MKLKIIAPGMPGPGPHRQEAKIFLDDKQIRRVTGVDISMRHDDANKATITFYPGSIEIEGDFEVEEKPGGEDDED